MLTAKTAIKVFLPDMFTKEPLKRAILNPGKIRANEEFYFAGVVG